MSCFFAIFDIADISVIVNKGLAGLSIKIALTSEVILFSKSEMFVVSSIEYFNPKFTSSVIEMEKKSSQFVTLNDVENDGCCKKICC